MTVGVTVTDTDTDTDTNTNTDIDTSCCDRCFLPTTTNREGCAMISPTRIDLHYDVLYVSNNCVNKSMIGSILILVPIIFILSRIHLRFVT